LTVDYFFKVGFWGKKKQKPTNNQTSPLSPLPPRKHNNKALF